MCGLRTLIPHGYNGEVAAHGPVGSTARSTSSEPVRCLLLRPSAEARRAGEGTGEPGGQTHARLWSENGPAQSGTRTPYEKLLDKKAGENHPEVDMGHTVGEI